MSYGELLYEIPNSLREMIRSLEKESRKLIKTEWSSKYYTSCLNIYQDISEFEFQKAFILHKNKQFKNFLIHHSLQSPGI